MREIEKRLNLWGGFRDEMIATALTLSLVVVGSFVVMERMMDRPEPEKEITVPVVAPNPQTLGVQDVVAAATPLPIEVSPTPQASPSGEPVEIAEVVYGDDGEYDFEAYTISFTNARLQFDQKTKLKRKMLISIKVKNKSISDGLPVKASASIVKDGVVIVPAAALYIPGSRKIGLGEEVSFEATLPLVEATDVREIKFKPGGEIVEASHFLYP